MAPQPIRTTLADGSDCELARPDDWNGYLVTQPDLWFDEVNDGIQRWLWNNGFASIRHSRDVRGWNIGQALLNEAESIALFRDRFGAPAKGTVVWGGSMGGLITRLLIEKTPDTYIGAIAMDGGGAGTLATFNRGFDMAYVIATLLAEQPVALVQAADADHEIQALTGLVKNAMSSPAGRARIALAAAVGGTPAWSDPSQPRPDPRSPEEEAEQLAFGVLSTLPQAYFFRLGLEQLVAGTFVSNDAVDYSRLLADSGVRQRVQHLYDIAGLSLENDLTELAQAPRISADPHAIDRVTQQLAVTGDIRCPVLVLKSIGDPDAVTAEEHAYAEAVSRSGASELVRWAWVDTPGHLNFTLAERITALTTLVERIESGAWAGTTTPAALNARAEALSADDGYDFTVYGALEKAPGVDFGLSRFVSFSPRPFGRANG